MLDLSIGGSLALYFLAPPCLPAYRMSYLHRFSIKYMKISISSPKLSDIYALTENAMPRVWTVSSTTLNIYGVFAA